MIINKVLLLHSIDSSIYWKKKLYMEMENIPLELERILSSLDKADLTVFEESIDMDVHFEYLDFVAEMNRKSKKSKQIALSRMDELFDENVDEDDKKELLARLAAITEVDAFRTIEKFVSTNSVIHQWALVALQESRMLLEGELLDEPKVHISTGLGGKGNKLRFLVVVFKKDAADFTELQERVVKNEFTFTLENNDAEFENIIFHNDFAAIKALIPIKSDFRSVLLEALKACNVFGDFLSGEVITTNVKDLSVEEIEKMLTEHKNGNRITDDIE